MHEAAGWHGQRVRPQAEKSTVLNFAWHITVDSGSFLAFADRATPRIHALSLRAKARKMFSPRA